VTYHGGHQLESVYLNKTYADLECEKFGHLAQGNVAIKHLKIWMPTPPLVICTLYTVMAQKESLALAPPKPLDVQPWSS